MNWKWVAVAGLAGLTGGYAISAWWLSAPAPVPDSGRIAAAYYLDILRQLGGLSGTDNVVRMADYSGQYVGNRYPGSDSKVVLLEARARLAEEVSLGPLAVETRQTQVRLLESSDGNRTRLAEARLALARAHLQLGDFSAVKDIAASLLESGEPFAAEASLLLAGAALKEGKRSEALVLLDQMLSSADINGKTRGQALARRGGILLRDDPEEAQKSLVEALQILEKRLTPTAPLLAVVHTDLGIIARAAGHLEAARREFMSAAKINFDRAGERTPAMVASLNNLGDVALMVRDWGEAERYLAEANQLGRGILGESDPLVVTIQVGYGEALIRQQKYDQALRLLRRAAGTGAGTLGVESPITKRLQCLTGYAAAQTLPETEERICE